MSVRDTEVEPARGDAQAPVLRHQRLFGVSFCAETLPRVVEHCGRAAETGATLVVAVVNAAKLVKMRRDPTLRSAVTESDLVLADGMSVVWASRLLGHPLPARVAGIDLFQALVAQAEERGRRVFFLGATEAVLRDAVEAIRAAHPRLRVAGARDGYFGLEEEEDVAREVRASGADYLFVGITSPKKEAFLARWGRELDVRVCHGVGGSFDVLAGRVRRAPAWMQRWGLEWLFRVFQEPRRLWRRYLVTNSLFVAMVVRERLRRSR